jgi:hypothetical protein
VKNEGNKENLTHDYGMKRNKAVVIVTEIIIIIAKGNVLPVHVMKAYGRSGGRAPLIFNLATKWKPVVNIRPRGRTGYPLHRRLGGPQGRCGRYGVEKNLLSLSKFEIQNVHPLG